MAVELVVKELFVHPEAGRRYQVGDLISDSDEMAWAQRHFPAHVMRKYAADPEAVGSPQVPPSRRRSAA